MVSCGIEILGVNIICCILLFYLFIFFCNSILNMCKKKQNQKSKKVFYGTLNLRDK